MHGCIDILHVVQTTPTEAGNWQFLAYIQLVLGYDQVSFALLTHCFNKNLMSDKYDPMVMDIISEDSYYGISIK